LSTAALAQLDLGLRRQLPLATAVLAVLIDLLPLPSPGPDSLTTLVTLAVVFFWCLHRPDLMPPLAAFAAGLVHDALAGLPLGLTALVLLLARHVVVQHQRLFHAKSFLVVWFCFALLALAVEALRWLLACLYWVRLFPPEPVLFELALTIVLYPCVSWLLVRLHAVIPRQAHAS
jgi:rod shape-determining protein MreD